MRSAIRAAWEMNAKEGMARLRKLAEWRQRDHPDAAASLPEGLEECFTIKLGPPAHAASLSGDRECDRELAAWCAHTNRARMSLASKPAPTLSGRSSWKPRTTSAAFMPYREVCDSESDLCKGK